MRTILRAIGRFGRTSEPGTRRRLGLGAIVGALMLVGHIGVISHQYEHLGDIQPEVVCQLCAAGDHFTPLPAAARPPPPLHFDTARVRPLHVLPPSRPLRVAHAVRAPPHSV